MLGYVIVGGSPWVAVCDRLGGFRFKDVPAGAYRLIVWHEMGEPLQRRVDVEAADIRLGTLVLQGSPEFAAKSSPVKVEPWSEVLDRIGMTLAMSLDAARQPGSRDRAVTLAQDAYFGDFEASDMEAAVRSGLGLKRAAEIESQFRAITRLVGDVADGKVSSGRVTDATRALFVKLARASQDLNSKGMTDRSKIPAAGRMSSGVRPVAVGGRDAQLAALESALGRVQELADRGQAPAASAAFGDAYFDAFEPIESDLRPSEPERVRAIETRFNVLRGELGSGIKGTALAERLGALTSEIRSSVEHFDARAAGTFGLGFAASLGTILREGVEVILLLTMLFALVAKAGQPRALASLWWGVGLAVLASLATALGLNLMVGAARGRTRELIEALVMLAASGVLFYVSYWLISQTESKRWLGFIKSHAQKGAELGGYFTLGLTAFLAVYREGAETALMYQALLARQTDSGRLGIILGLGLGVVLLAGFFVLVRATSGRLPLRRFFQVTGGLLFAMAVVFAGQGVFELQSAGFEHATPVTWIGAGLPAFGVYPNSQCLAVQAILLSGAIVALALIRLERRFGLGTESARPIRPAPQQTVGAGA
jgi:high-affinity iron transporter